MNGNEMESESFLVNNNLEYKKKKKTIANNGKQ